MLKVRTKLILAGLMIFLLAGPAYPEDRGTLELQADVIRLAERVKLLQSSLDQNSAILKGLVEKMSDQVNNLAVGLQKVSEAVDSLRVQGNNTSAEVRVILTNLGNHLNQVQNGLSDLQAQVASVSDRVTAAKTTVEPLPGPEDLMRAATVDALAGNYDLAVSDYKEFLSKYPNDPRAADAHLGLAQSYFNLKKYDQAFTEYDLLIQNYPENDKRKIALYKEGLALAAQGQLPGAIDTLNQLVKAFPYSDEAASAKLRIRELRELQRHPHAAMKSTITSLPSRFR